MTRPRKVKSNKIYRSATDLRVSLTKRQRQQFNNWYAKNVGDPKSIDAVRGRLEKLDGELVVLRKKLRVAEDTYKWHSQLYTAYFASLDAWINLKLGRVAQPYYKKVKVKGQ